ncbi:MAG: hypothetical protein BWY47_00279 [Bacteroidetes bacterium ADurb.Bin302]|nr:MAG: hypothetical protein BWY47_00279 [Bacteroidetes bacterium ADurb.Bin302]
MPDFSRDPVDLSAGSKVVVALQNGTETTDDKDYVWLSAVGVYEQVTVSTSKTDAGNNYAADSNDQEKKDIAQQIANNISVEVGGDTYTVKAEKTSSGWDYVLVDEDKQVSEEYSVSGTPVVNVSTDEETAITTTTVAVSVVDANEVPVALATSAIENGSDKAAEKSKYVAELISNDAELREFLAGTKQKGKLANNVSNPTVETTSTRYVYANGRNVELDLAGFTLDGYEICVDDGSTLTLTGNGIVNLDGEEPIFITNGNLVMAGVTISGKVGGTSYSNLDSSYASGLVYFCHEGDQNITMNLIIADDTINYISVLDGEGTLTLNVVGQEKGNGILNMSTTGNSESYANGIREYAGGGHVDTIVRNCVLNISAAGNLNNGYTNNFVLENIIGSVFSQDCSDYCISGYATIYSNSSAKYEFAQITEQNASIEVTNSDSTKFYAVNLGSAMRNVGSGGTIKLLKNVVYNGTIDDLTIDSFNIDLNGKTITGSWGFFNPNETNYNVHDTVTVTISNGSIDGCLNLYHNTLITLIKYN